MMRKNQINKTENNIKTSPEQKFEINQLNKMNLNNYQKK